MRSRSDLKTIEAFVAVAREGNVSRAAERLFLTQPAVSLQLRKLALETGLELFQRTPRGVDLTPDGKVLLVKAELVLAALAEFDGMSQRLTQELRGQLRIGTVVDPAFIRLGGVLGALVEAAPKLETRLFQGMSGEVLLKLLRDELDIGYFLGLPDDMVQVAGALVAEKGGVTYHELTRFQYRVLAPAGWDGRVKGLGWAELARLPWIGTPPQSVHHRLIRAVLQPLGVEQNTVTLADQETSMLALVRSGVGLCLARDAVAQHEKQAHGLVMVEDLHLDASLAVISLQRRQSDPQIKLATQIVTAQWTPGSMA